VVGDEARVHELSLMDDLVDVVAEEVGDRRVHIVRLEVGRHACASPHALRFCFEICAHGTVLEGAQLEIIETMGDELRLKELELEAEVT
jgi:hydrogenase nickel incorporation protein HypA/HybF